MSIIRDLKVVRVNVEDRTFNVWFDAKYNCTEITEIGNGYRQFSQFGSVGSKAYAEAVGIIFKDFFESTPTLKSIYGA